MATSSQIFQNKRGRNEYLNGGLALPEAKRSNSVYTLAHDSDLMAFLDKFDNMDNNNSNPEDIHLVNEVEGEMRPNGFIKSLKDENGLKAQTDNKIDQSSNEKGSSDQLDSVCDRGIDFTYYDNVGAELGFFADHITPLEFEIIMNHWPCHVEGDSMPHYLYSDALYGNAAETREVFYGSLWEDDIWQLSEHPVIQNGFVSPQQEELGINGDEFHGVSKR